MTQQDERTSVSGEKREGRPSQSREPAPSQPQTNDGGGNQTSGYGNREDRENPEKGLQQSGTRQPHDLPGEGTRVGEDERRESRSMSQNAARVADFEERPTR